MSENIINILFLIPIVALLFLSVLANNRNQSVLVFNLSKVIPFIAMAVSVVGAVWLLQTEITESFFLGVGGIGFSTRIDALSVIMYGMVSIIALVVFRFSMNYLDGDEKQVQFFGKLALTIAFVQLLVLSGNIFILFAAWFVTSMALHSLLLFYSDRRKARIAARKKFIMARFSDFSFLAALILLYLEFGTGNIELILSKIQLIGPGAMPLRLELSGLLLVLTACLKSVQIPFHGWILEVMEAPTPVSALLHAGLLNAGPFLMIRFSFLISAMEFAPVVLFVIGGVTALFGAVVYSTQSTVKTALAYSSIGHMGFTLMLCGLGLYAAALLHLTAHSFYKAHSFLSSGSIIEKVQVKKSSSFKREGKALRILVGFILAGGLYALIATLWGLNINSSFQLLIIGGVVFAGIVGLLITVIDSNSYGVATLMILGAAIAVLMSFFALEESFRHLLSSLVPKLTAPSLAMKILSSLMLVVFFLTVMFQALSPLLKQNEFFRKAGIHLRNGLYIQVVFDRVLNTLSHRS